MKKKPHQKQSAIKKVFADFRKRLHPSKHPQNGIDYEVIESKDGYTVVIHKERGANKTLHFKTKQALNNYLKSI